jgi:hypothetical protein
MRQVQFDPMTLRVRATGQSAVSCLVTCFCIVPFYPSVTLLAIDYYNNSDYDFNSLNQWSQAMTPEIPGYLVALESALRPFVVAIALGLIWMGAYRMKGPAPSRYMTAGAISLTLAGWLAVARYVGSANMYFVTTDTAVPTLLFGVVIPLMIAAAGLWLSGAIRSLVSAIPLRWLVAAQVYRIEGGIFLVLWADGRLPWQFALPAGIGDFTTGVLAVVLAARLARNAIGTRRAVYAWCLFGIADLVVAITMGAVTSPGRPHLLAFEAPNLLITSYPLVMIPTFAVPLALMLHGLVLWRLRREPASNGQLATA